MVTAPDLQHNVFSAPDVLMTSLTLQPSHLRGWSIALFIASRDAENNGRFGGVVDVSALQTGATDDTLRRRAAVDTHESELRRLTWFLVLSCVTHG